MIQRLGAGTRRVPVFSIPAIALAGIAFIIAPIRLMGQVSSGSKPKNAPTNLATPDEPDAQSTTRGKVIFSTNCAFCHGASATGGDTGPSLVRSELVLHDHGTGEEISPVLASGRPAKGMPQFSFTPDQVHDLAAFLLNRIIAAANRQKYERLNIVVGDPAAGAAYFQKQCANCHSVTQDLAHIASKYEAQKLQENILLPDVNKQVKVTMRSGTTYSGTLIQQDDFSVSFRDGQGKYRSVTLGPAGGVANVQVLNPVEAHLKMLYTVRDDDVGNVLAYLETLK